MSNSGAAIASAQRVARALLALTLLASCTRDAPERAAPDARRSAASSAAPPPAAEDAGLRYLERVTGGASASDRLPLVVAIHGLGDRPESFVELFASMPARARLVVPYGPEPWGDGFAWFAAGTIADEDRLAASAKIAADRLAVLIDTLARTRSTLGKPIVTGFSQGGILSFTLAALHPESIGAAFPVGGFLAKPLWPSDWPLGRATPRIRAFHGAADERVPIARARASVERLVRIGVPAELVEYAGVGHTVAADERRDLWKAIDDAARGD